MTRGKVGTAVAAAALVVAACGGGSSSSKAVSTFRSQANGICNRYAKQQNALPKPGLTSSLQDIGKYVSAVESSVGKELGELGGLTPPSSEKVSFDAAMSAARNDLTQVRSAFGDVDHMSLTQLASAEQAAETAGSSLKQKFAAAGVTACGSVFSST